MTEPSKIDLPKDLQPPQCTLLRLRRTTRRVTQIYDHHLAPLGLRITQYSLLGNLMGQPPMPIGTFAEIMGMDRTTLTRNIRPLIRAGWIDLVAGEDRRQRAIALTADGKAIFRRAVPLWRQAESDLRAAVGADAISQLQHLLDHSLERIAPQA
ncbi:MarR family winged helix-turn-helix transcriptional regulator [Reyranella sp. CPCC 100927]|uniref:MarR family winged helix-turn-helix transcriptional regulator n=1 Tax=Reyranella sp. CPCC 100927 TaxID=2599616 RepID=UPI0011B7795A|nr:MarR family winged helix-turn-helix transcriptional regulator [Reyranella sp. CPCC 100927]TWT01268.1 winged helix-turn-helix transcriptional regulator [Reyranella sp. CPCC 100927]